VNKTQWNKIAGEKHSFDPYVHKGAVKSGFADGDFFCGGKSECLGDIRFFTVAGNVRKLLGASVKVDKTVVRGEKMDVTLKEMFLCPDKEMAISPEKVYPASGWLSSSSSKVATMGVPKSRKVGWNTPVALHQTLSVRDKPKGFCKFSGKCRNTCLKGTGNLTLSSSLRSRYAKSWFFITRPMTFLRLLIHEIMSESAKAHKKGSSLYLRLNGMSDIPWEKYLNMDKLVKDVTGLGGFYDYTKFPKKRRPQLPRNYKIVFSIDEKKSSWKWAKEWLDDGHCASIVCEAHKKRKPRRIMNMIELNPHVIDGDTDDGRFADKPGTLVVLRCKGTLKPETHLDLVNGRQTDLITPTPILLQYARELQQSKQEEAQ